MRLRTFGGLWIERDAGQRVAGARPRPLALLAILAVAGAKGLTRDRALAVLWPETDEERARQSLSQAIYSLRRDVGVDVADASGGLRLDPAQLSSDVGEFRAAVAARDWATAATLYSGPFLDGFHLADAPEFERWMESERGALATQGIRAIEIVARSQSEVGRHEVAVDWWHRLTYLDPNDSRIAASYMEALAALGDRAAALAHGRAHAEHLRRELEVEPDPGFERLMARLRVDDSSSVGRSAGQRVEGSSSAHQSVGASGAGVATSMIADAPTYAPSAGPAPGMVPAASRASRGRARAWIAIAAVAVLLGAAGAWWATRSRTPATPTLAVGRIRDLAAPDSAALGAVLSEMLATSLGRLSEIPVIANSRMLELTPRDADTSRAALTDAARRAGATEIVEGELIPVGDRELRLEVRRVDIARGLVRGGYRVSGSDRIALFDSVTALIAADLRVGAPAGSLAEVSTRSPVAHRYYEEGLRALYQFDAYAANRLFQSAVREDSSFAMAAYYAWRTARALQDSNEVRLGDRAVALASRAPTRERLLILAHVGAERADLRAVAAAESLAALNPRDPEALVRAAEVTPELPRAVDLLERSVALDSATPTTAAMCRMCEALSQLATRYEWADSGAAVERTLRRWQRLRPSDAAPWGMEADWLIGFGRRAEAYEARRRFESLGGTHGNVQLDALVESLRLDDFDAAERECSDGLTSADVATFTEYRWYCVLLLRNEGRYREAIALARDGRVPRSSVVRRGIATDAYQLGTLDMESGRALAAADEFLGIYRGAGASATTTGARVGERSTSANSDDRPAGLRARYLTWALTLGATAAVTGGDTARARGLVDSIEAVGRRSLYRRDPLLHHFVRGILYAHAGENDAAVRELRAAMQSPTFGYTRINYELARSLLALKRPAEGVPAVQAALHGGIEGSGAYVTRTELHELLAQLFEASGRADSARVHWGVVARAWRSADPAFAERYRVAVERGGR